MLFEPHGNRAVVSFHHRRLAADQLASAFRRASLDGNGHAVDCQCAVGGNDLVQTVRFAAGIKKGARDLVAQSSDRSAPDVVVGRAVNHRAAMIGFVSDCNDRQ